MDRVEISSKYASECERIITENGDDYRNGSVLIDAIPIPENLHPMLVPIADNFRGEADDKYYWSLIRTKVTRFLANDWEPTAWWAVIMYGYENDGLVKHTYSLSIQRQGSATIYESGNDRLIEVTKEFANSLNQNQTDEWFIYSLLQRLPKKIDELSLQSTEVVEVTTTDWNEIKY
jgi:hypothetical protein